MTFGHKYWPTLDEAKPAGVPGSPWTNYQVNQLTKAAVHPNGMIDVLGRTALGNQYISLIADDKFPRVAQVYSNSVISSPPSIIYPGSLFEGAGPKGIGEISSGIPYNEQNPPLCILPWDTTPGVVVDESSQIISAGAAPYLFPYVTRVTFRGARAPWPDCVITTYYEVLNKRYLNYIFAAGDPGTVRGLVSFWSASVKADGTVVPELEYFAVGCGRL